MDWRLSTVRNNVNEAKFTANRHMSTIFDWCDYTDMTFPSENSIQGLFGIKHRWTWKRVLIEMNKNIRCGPETHIIPRMIARWELGRGTKRMDDSGINSNLYDEICSEFILKIIAKHDYGSQQLCNKDPFTLRYMKERHLLEFHYRSWFPERLSYIGYNVTLKDALKRHFQDRHGFLNQNLFWWFVIQERLQVHWKRGKLPLEALIIKDCHFTRILSRWIWSSQVKVKKWNFCLVKMTEQITCRFSTVGTKISELCWMTVRDSERKVRREKLMLIALS